MIMSTQRFMLWCCCGLFPVSLSKILNRTVLISTCLQGSAPHTRPLSAQHSSIRRYLVRSQWQYVYCSSIVLYACDTEAVQPQSCGLTAPEHLGTEEIICALPKIWYLVRTKWTLFCAAIPLPKAYFWKYLLVLARRMGLQLSLSL